MILPNLNPLRFLLAFTVMIFHIPQFFKNRGLPYFDDFSVFHKGTEAVYVFFVLSGFLIIRLLYRERENTGKVGIRKFYMRRILRIYPLYFLIMIVGFLYYNVVLEYLGIPYANDYDIVNAVLLYTFFLPNVASGLYQPGGAIEILWSIGIEEQFYLFIAPTLAYLNKRFFSTFLIIFTLGYFVLFATDIFPFLRKFDFLYFYFSTGGLFAILHEKYDIGNRIHKYFKVLILLVFTLYFCTNILQGINLNLYHFIGMILFSFVILTLSYSPVINIRNSFVNYLGRISYGIYMYHALVMQLIGLVLLKLVDKIQMPDFVVILLSYGLVFGVTIIVSHFSYVYFEKPFLKLKNKFR
ncbi:acyltransferase [Kordia sp. YSTF-M3]|uniref:Acyltransferase n=1 Tax=Kordia aestuariivivens TaxID=2759037 RepID=A0ABR7Q8J9_9FLAO|nr:acyltransferase [Kordia aestuariivivens]MBC8754887.1 acyltransferase [Kordia aestuariivivens]